MNKSVIRILTLISVDVGYFHFTVEEGILARYVLEYSSCPKSVLPLCMQLRWTNCFYLQSAHIFKPKDQRLKILVNTLTIVGGRGWLILCRTCLG